MPTGEPAADTGRQDEVVLLTGATGFLGGHLAQALHAAGFRLVVLKRSGSVIARINALLGRVPCYDVDRGGVEEAFTAHDVGCVVHCATNYGRDETTILPVLEANLLLPARLLERLAHRGRGCFVNCDTALDRRISPYALAKKQFREWLERQARTLSCVNVVLEQFYGPGDNRPLFVARLIAALVRGEAEFRLTPGEQRRDFVYIDDAVAALLAVIGRAVRAAPGYHEYGVGSGQPVSIREFVELARRLAGNQTTRLLFGALPYREHELMASQVDTTALRELGWRPKVTLAEGLRRTIAAAREETAR